jgi:hypothetical protein
MQIRFFIGVHDKEIIPRNSKDDPVAHYAWCLDQLINNLNNSSDDPQVKREILNKFQYNMNLSPGTRQMLGEVSSLFAALIQSKNLPDNSHIINCLKGLPVGTEKSYISYRY